MNLSNITKAILIAGCAVSVTNVNAENAQEESGTKKLAIEKIQVTAQKRLETQQEVAVTVNTIDGDSLIEKGVVDLTDIENLTAGIQLDGESGHDVTISVRGVGSKSISGLEPSVAVFIDGVVQNNVGSAFGSLLDINRVEILRGPQGTLYGKNAPAGAINIVTNDPNSQEFEGNVSATVSSWNTSEFKGTLNLPIVKDEFAVRVSALTSESDGYIDNIFLNDNANSSKRDVTKIKALYTPLVNLSALFSYVKSDSEIGNPLQLLGENIWEFESNENTPGKAIDESETTSLTLNWDIGDYEVTLISANQTYNLTGPRDNDFTPLAVGEGGSILSITQELEATSHELRVTSYNSDDFEFMAGVFYSDQETLGGSAFDNGVFNQSLSGVDNTTSLGVFSNNSYFIDDEWTVTFGLRYSSDEKSVKSNQIDSLVGAVEGNDKDTFESVSGSLKLRYMPDVDHTYYVSLDRAYKAGGFNVVAPQNYKDAGFDKFDSEYSNAIEVGSKVLMWDERFQLNTSIFYQTFDNFQSNVFITEQAIVFAPQVVIAAPAGNMRINGSDATTHGAELEFTALLSEQLTITGSVAYNKVEVGEFENVPTTFADAGYTTAGPAIIDPRILPIAGGDPTIVPTTSWTNTTFKGNPQLTSNLYIEYLDQVSGFPLDWFVRLNVKYNDERDQRVLSGYNTADLSFGLNSQDGKWNANIWIKNLTNEEYLIYGVDKEVNGLGVDAGFPGAPRAVGATVSYSF